MKINEAINRLDALKSNTYTQSEKIEWLSRLDSMVKRQILDAYDGSSAVSFSGYTEDTDPQTELLVPAPFDEIYLRWLEAQIHYHNGEYDKYNNAIMMFNTSFEAYADWYNRHNTPVSRGARFLF